MARDLPRHWMPLVEAPLDTFKDVDPKIVQTTMEIYGVPEDEARAMLERDHLATRYFVNNLYQVQVRLCGHKNSMLHINIRRRDGGMFKDWRHFQQIKNEIAGEECEAVELYPAESRKVDSANKWHLWCFPEGVRLNIGWETRDVQYDENRDVPGMRQRPL